MSIETIATILFLITLSLFLLKNRKNLQIQKILGPFIYFAMYKTKLGLKQMDNISTKHPKLVDRLSKIGVYVGVLGIFLIAYLLIKNLADLFLIPQAISGVSLVLPFKVKGGFYVPFFYWIVSIFVVATIHEFSHGVVARLHKVPVKSSGFAFLAFLVPVLPAAFVEPDEKILDKKTRMQKLSMFAAGPFSNILSGALFLILFLTLTYPVASKVIDFNGVTVEGYTNGSNSDIAGIPEGSIINNIGGVQVLTLDNLSYAIQNDKVGDNVTVTTTNGTYTVTLGSSPENYSLPYLGVLVSQSQKTKPEFENRYGKFAAPTILWVMGLFYWIYVLSLGIGLFNLVPVGPIDGGLMAKEIFKGMIKDENKALKAWNFVSLFFLAIIIVNLLAGFF